MNILNKKLFYIFFSILFVELLSFLGYFYPWLNKTSFLLIALIFLLLVLVKFEYGVLIVLLELFISSKGYLFFYDLGNGASLSIRIVFWLILISVWFAKTAVSSIKNKKVEIEFSKSVYFPYFMTLFIFIIWGFVNGFINHNIFSNVFFDFNGWLYWLLIFPIFSAVNNKENFINGIIQGFIASIVWVSLKTFFLLYIFSHNVFGISEIYRWIRSSGVGEITQVMGGFYRIFFQSHIFVLIGFFVFLIFLNSFSRAEIEKNKKIYILSFLVFAILMAVNLISFSRSNWLGIVSGLLFFFGFTFWKLGWKKILNSIVILFISLILSFAVIVLIIKFPYPDPTGGFDTGRLFRERATQVAGEAGATSRWELLPKLWAEIKDAPVLGKGFGATVTYKTSDPRVLKENPNGEYTTYAFEWGWLDIWLKLGIFGILAYLALLFIILLKTFKNFDNSENRNYILNFGILIGVVSIAVVSVFSPYMNHPLGIGYLMAAVSILSCKKIKS